MLPFRQLQRLVWIMSRDTPALGTAQSRKAQSSGVRFLSYELLFHLQGKHSFSWVSDTSFHEAGWVKPIEKTSAMYYKVAIAKLCLSVYNIR